jgi:hypothetical protein
MAAHKPIGIHRFECRDCGSKWSIGKDEFFRLGYPAARGAHHCEGTDKRRQKHIDSLRRYQPNHAYTIETIFWGNTLEAEKVIISRSIRYKKTNHPTECGDRCRGARGADCDCRCGGEYHGVDS